MTDEAKKDLPKQPEDATPKTGIEPLHDDDLESVAGGYCSAAACSAKAD